MAQLEVPDVSEVDYDPFSPAVLADPMAAYAELRERCPVHRFEAFSPPFATITRHADVVAVLKDVDTWSSRYGQAPQFSRPRCLNQDPPEHTEFRKLFQRGFAPRTVAGLEAEITELATELLDEMEPLGRGDLHDLFACPLPVILIAKLLGVPPADLSQFKQWSDDLVATFNDPDPRAGDRAREEMGAYFQGFVDERRRLLDRGEELPNDLISGFVTAELGGRRLTDDELHTILIQLLLGGNETTTSLLTNLVVRLLEEPSRWEAVKAGPSLVEVAVEESLRYDPPVLGLFRTSLRPTTMHGVDLPERTKLMVTYASANRDPAVWDDPDTFRLDRPLDEVRGHLSFGLGHHFCPGAPLSRLEARIALRLFVERLPRLRLDGPSERIEPFTLWGRRTLPVAWD